MVQRDETERSEEMLDGQKGETGRSKRMKVEGLAEGDFNSWLW